MVLKNIENFQMRTNTVSFSDMLTFSSSHFHNVTATFLVKAKLVQLLTPRDHSRDDNSYSQQARVSAAQNHFNGGARKQFTTLSATELQCLRLLAKGYALATNLIFDYS